MKLQFCQQIFNKSSDT